jgi:hypothetical protein
MQWLLVLKKALAHKVHKRVNHWSLKMSPMDIWYRAYQRRRHSLVGTSHKQMQRRLNGSQMDKVNK